MRWFYTLGASALLATGLFAAATDTPDVKIVEEIVANVRPSDEALKTIQQYLSMAEIFTSHTSLPARAARKSSNLLFFVMGVERFRRPIRDQ